MMHEAIEQPSKPKKKPPQKDKAKEERGIPDSKLIEFVGPVKRLFQIDAIQLWDDYFRINVWISTYGNEASVVPSFEIEKSFFVCYREGVIIDSTIQPKPKKEKIF